MKTKTIWYVILVLLCCGAVLAVQQAATKPLQTKTTTTSLSAPAKTPVKGAPISAGNPAARAAVQTPVAVEPIPCDDMDMREDALWVPVPAEKMSRELGIEIEEVGSDRDDRGPLDQGAAACPGTVIPSIPYTDNGVTNSTYINNYTTCTGIWTSSGYDVVYTYTATSNILVDISLCATGSLTNFDTKLNLWKTTCGGTTCFRANDDYCITDYYPTDAYVSHINAVQFVAGGVYYINVDGYSTADLGNYTLSITPSTWVPALTCPANSIYSQPPYNGTDPAPVYVNYSDLRNPPTNVTSIYFDEYAVDEPICDIHWWGLPRNSTATCAEDPMTFLIRFCPDAAGIPDIANPTCSYTASVTGIPVAWGTGTMYYYSLNLDPCCNLLSGWVSVEGTSDPNTCWFAWLTSPIGNAYSLVNYGGTWYFSNYDVAFCLTPGAEEIFGACCYPETWTCVDNVLSTDCIGAGGIFYPNQLCTEITCEEPVLCVVECPVGGTPEGELCTEDLNGGCNMDVPAFTTIACDQTICGLSWCDGTTRDTDWYQIVLASPMTVTMTAQTEFNAVAGFIDFPPCVDGTTAGACDLVTAIDPYVVLDSCVQGQVSYCLPAGTWWLFVAPATYTDIVDCRDYYLTVTCAPCVVPVAACCYGDPGAPDCDNLTECACEQMGGTWYVGEDCATFDCPEEVLCPAGTMYGQKPHKPSEVWQFTTSELDPGYSCFDDFYSATGPISGVTFWGINLFHDGTQWNACTENPMTFAITFYNFDPSDPTRPDLTTPVATYTLSLTGTPVDALFAGLYQEYQYTAVLDPPVTLNPGWIAIQGQGAVDCWFLWSSSPEGFDGSLQWSGTEWTVNDANRAFCLAPSACDPPAEVTAYLITGGIEVWFDAPGAGTYVIYSSTNPNNDGDPDGGTDPDFTPAATIPVVTAGAYNWLDAGYAASSYKNYVVVRSCPSLDPGLGRCCYGTGYQTCEAGVTWQYCAGLNGQWYYTLGCPCPAPAYCAAGATCDEFIMDFTVGTISNLGTACGTGGYTDYTAMSTSMTIGTGYPCTVFSGLPYTDDACAIWVDWNQDLDWDDAGEEFLTTTADFETFTATITPPVGSLTGNTRMRARIVWNETPLACGTRAWGETEDYIVNVVP